MTRRKRIVWELEAVGDRIDIADALESIAKKIREGYLSGIESWGNEVVWELTERESIE